MISITGTGKQYNMKEFTVDTVAEIAELPVECAMGSTAFVIANSSVWILNGSKQWVLISASSGSDDDDEIIYDGGQET